MLGEVIQLGGGISVKGGEYTIGCFFFSSRRRHTRFDCDWSSDVCSSDLPAAWQTLEVPVDLDVAISSLQGPKQLAVIDCLTVYLANVMSKAEGKESVIRDHMERLCSALKETRASIILVSNEVGSGVHAATATGRFYCDLLGELNQRVAALADNVILMVAGIPVAVKGKVPLAAHSTFEIDHEVLGAARL